MEPIFVENLPGHAGRSWVETLTPLMSRPGDWAIIAEFNEPQKAANSAGNFRRRNGLPQPGSWQFVSRTHNGKSNVYARYLGPDN